MKIETIKKVSLELSDTDLWGLQNALVHGLQDGYFDDNKEWAINMLIIVNEKRDLFL